MNKDNAERIEKLDALSGVFTSKRSEYVDARKSSGIEEVWMNCEDSYLGIDDANRHEFKNAQWAKPTSMQGSVTSESTYQKNDPRSNVFVRLTSRYVDAGAAKLAEILLPVDDKPFSFSPTPVPDLVNDKEDNRPAMTPQGKPIMKPAAAAVQQSVAPQPQQVPNAPAPQQGMPAPDGAPTTQPPGAAPVEPMTIGDFAKEIMDEADDCAKRADTRIYDWMVECNFHAENRKIIHDAARIGVGVLKGPFPELRKSQSAEKLNGVLKLKIVEKIVPSAKWVDPWNLFPDPACGENIHDGEGIFERDFLTARKLKALSGKKGYIASQIKKVIEEGPEKCNTDSINPAEKDKKKRFSVWYYYGAMTRKDLESANSELVEKMDKSVDEFYCIVTMVNDSVIRAVLNPLESGTFPYHAMPWSRRAGSWAGVGVAEQLSGPQRMLNASTRALLNNAGLSCGPQIVIDRQAIEPAQANDWVLRPNKIWFKSPDAVNPDVRTAFMSVVIPNVGDQMNAIIALAERQAEEATNIPLISQGQTGPTTPDTLGATQLQNNNANTLLRSIGYSYDDHITEPVVRAYYEYLLLDPEVPDDEKGDCNINAHGSVALVERAIQDQTLAMMTQMVLNPAFGINPKSWLTEWLKSNRLDPRTMQYTEEEQKKMAEAPPPEDPAVTVAKIRAESAKEIEGMKLGQETAPQGVPQAPDNSLQIAQLKAQTDLQKAQMDMQAKQAAAEQAAAEAQKQREHDLQMKQIDLQIKQLELQAAQQSEQAHISASQQESLDTAKTELAKTTINDQTKRELAEQETNLAITLDQAGKDHDVRMNPPSLVRDELSTDETP
jgi:hypothetical protein